MIRHIVAWQFKDGFSDEENAQHAAEIAQKLTALVGVITEIVELKIVINPLASSTRSAILNTLFASEADLHAYQVHPAHKAVSAYVGQVMQDRVCLDYEE